MDAGLADRLLAAVAAREQELTAFAQALVRERSLLGEEEGAQRLVAERLAALGFAVARVAIEPRPDEDGTWGYPPLSYSGRTCVGARIGRGESDRSLHLSGHVDVVPVEHAERWIKDPWAGEVADGRLWGRGAGDMKAGLAAYLIAAEAYLEVCGMPRGELMFSSVIEEECTGNGMKAVLAAGYVADATLIGEPSALQLMHAGVGVIWARLRAESTGAHIAFSSGASSSSRLLEALDALRELERGLNPPAEGGEVLAGPDRVFFAEHDRPFRLNVGTLAGGAWPSSEPVAAEARIRLGFGLETTPAQAQRLVADAVAARSEGVEVTFEGFRANAYADSLDHELARALGGAHARLHGAAPVPQALPGTTDARYVRDPCICYGPAAGGIHGSDEWVDVASMRAVAGAVALTLADWFGA